MDTQPKEPDALPCRFEQSPPYRNWSFCRVSSFHMKPQPIRMLHYHAEFELGLCVSGEGQLYLGDRVIPYRAGDVQIILPGQPHYNIAAAEGTVWHFLSFLPSELRTAHLTPDREWIGQLQRDCRASGVFPPDRYPLLAAAASFSVNAALRPPTGPFDGDSLAEGLLHLLVLLSRTGDDSGGATHAAGTDIGKILPALTGFSQALDRGVCLTVPQMAALCHFSPSHFRRIFSERMGQHPKKYILSVQLDRAAQLLLSTALPVGEVCRQVGFTDSTVFFRNFVDRYGVSPTSYRKNRH